MANLDPVKERSRNMWAAGDYASVADRIADMGRTTVDLAGVREGDRVLDVACGAGNAALPAAERGARVTGLDLVPSLLEAGRRAADEAGLEIEWVEGDCEALPYEDGSFDVVLSTVGIMFAPNHRVAAEEIARVLRPGGRIGIASWTPEGATGEFFVTVAKHMPPPPEGFQPPALWGTEDHVRMLFEGTGIEPRFERRAVEFDFESSEEEMEMFESKFGPVLMAKAALEPDGKWQTLRSELVELFERLNQSGTERVLYPAEYLVALGEKR